MDSVLRLFATTLVEDPHKLLLPMLEDQPFSKIKDRHGKQLHDKYLYEQAAQHFPWISEVYRTTSGFVHLSGKHLLVTARQSDAMADAAGRGFTFGLSSDGPEWADAYVLEAVTAFSEATSALYGICQSWVVQKARVGRERRGPAEDL